MRNQILGVLGLTGALLGGCTTSNPAFEEAQSVCSEGEFYVRQPFQLADPQKVDILFVVDNSPGSLVNQQMLAAAMPGFVTALEGVLGLDWRIAVTSTDLPRDQGRLLSGAAGQTGCPATRPTIVDGDATNPGLLARCNVLLGEGGDVITQGFQAARLAVEGDNDFSRDDARLVVVFVSRRDDCTTNGGIDRDNPDECIQNPSALFSVEDFARYFEGGARALDGNPVSVVAIVGPDDGRVVGPTDTLQAACNGAGPVFSGNRYAELASYGRLARHSAVYSLCTVSLAETLRSAVTDAVAPADDQVCAGLPMSGAPQAVVLRPSAQAEESTDLSPAGDFLALGPVDGCDNGAVAIATDVHDDDTGHRAEVWFCTGTDPSAQ